MQAAAAEISADGQKVFARDRLLTVAQVAKRLTLSQSSIYNMINSGQLRAIRLAVGKGLRVRESVLDEFVKKREMAFCE